MERLVPGNGKAPPAGEGGAGVKTKVCKTCGEEKPVEEFGGHAHTADRLHSFCRPCFGDHISAARRRQMAVPSPSLGRITKEEWHEMFMVLVCGGNRRIDDAKRIHGENSHQYQEQLGRTMAAVSRLHALMPKRPD